MADVETPPVVDREALVPTRAGGASMVDRWVNTDPDGAIKRVETMVKVLEQLRVASIKATYPSDWIIHTSKDSDGGIIRQVGYLQDCGAERGGKVWGIEVGNPAIEREDFPDGTYSYHMIADAWSKVTGERLDYVEGSRWSGDAFFQRQVKNDGDKVDPTDVRKAAYANLHGRAVRALGGLSAVPLDTLRQAGLDTAKVVMIAYDKGAKGGESTGASVGTTDVKVAFGRSAGKAPAELEDKDLAWYIGAYTENVNDPKKAKFQRANQRVLDALKAEVERRAQGAAHDAATGTKAPEAADESSADGKPTALGTKRSDLNTRLLDACGGVQKHVGPVLRAATKDLLKVEKGSLSDLTETEIDTIAKTPDDILKTLAKAVIGGKA